MDLRYLLFLQNFRETSGQWLAPIAKWASDCAIGFWPLLLACLIYWVFDRKSGKRIIAGFGMGMLVNGLLKLTFCVYRPWIRDSRIIPYGDAIVTATGYSFPSGHSTWATSLFGGSGWWMRKRNKILTGILFFMVALTMFSRNFLGVHTPQDVVVGCFTSVIVLIIVNKIENWSDKDINRDKYILIGGLALCALLILFYYLKPYPMDYQPDGSLLVDPAKMRVDAFQGIGFISSFVICRYFERRHFNFDQVLINWKDRFIIAIPAFFPLAWWRSNAISLFSSLVNRTFGEFIDFAVVIFYVMILVPWIMSKVHIAEHLKSEINLLRSRRGFAGNTPG